MEGRRERERERESEERTGQRESYHFLKRAARSPERRGRPAASGAIEEAEEEEAMKKTPRTGRDGEEDGGEERE